jgi:hypothetical protein
MMAGVHALGELQVERGKELRRMPVPGIYDQAFKGEY